MSDMLQDLYHTIDVEGILEEAVKSIADIYGLEDEVVNKTLESIDCNILWGILLPEWCQRFSPEFTEQYIQHKDAFKEFGAIMSSVIQDSITVSINKGVLN